MWFGDFHRLISGSRNAFKNDSADSRCQFSISLSLRSLESIQKTLFGRRQLVVWPHSSHAWANHGEVVCVPAKPHPWNPNGEESAIVSPWLEPGCLTCLEADRCSCLAPVDRKVAGHKTRAIFCCAESRWWHGAADGYGLKPGLKQKVLTTHELPEKEPDVTVCRTEVENYWEASIEISLWGAGAALCLASSSSLWNFGK